VGFAVILLIAPAALHRISFAGEDTADFLRLGSAFVIAAPAFLAVGIAGDLFVATFQAAGSKIISLAVALASMILLILFWFVVPLYIRRYRVSGG
jgi:Na+-driven multidrug efflux pump